MCGVQLQNRYGRVLPTAAVLAGAVATLAAAAPARAGVATYRLGEQDFAHLAGPVLVSQAKAAGANEAYPFDGTVFGDDRTKSFGTVSFAYALAAPPAAAPGTLTLGLIGLDATPGSPATVRLFLDGIEQPNDAFAGVSSPLYRSSASVVTVPVPADLLADGRLEVTVKAVRHGPAFPGNAIEADFSTLTVATVGRPGGGTTGGSIGGIGGIGDPVDGTPDPDGNGLPPGSGGTPGGNPPGGNGNSGGGGGGTSPVPSVPLPPAVLSGGVGLLLAAVLRRRR
ncbi:MAG: hypothetical protein JWO31_1917 [Phycisphaerales bacterium]|nr:hypothetical protein [Phycisphaerales bacterium]